MAGAGLGSRPLDFGPCNSSATALATLPHAHPGTVPGMTPRRIVLSGVLVLAASLSSGCGGSSPAASAPASTPVAKTKASLGVRAPGVIAFRRYLDEAKTTSAIFTIKADGTHERQVSHPPNGRVDTQPAISADGSQLAWEYCQNGSDGSCHVLVSRVDGSGEHEVRLRCPHGPVCDPQTPAWAPDGRLVLWLAWGRFKNDEIEHSQLVVSKADGTHPRVVVNPPAFRAETDAPVWSPDGTRIAYEARRYAADGSLESTRIAVVSADGGRPHEITPPELAAGDHIDWSPDGHWILFRTHNNEDSGPTELSEIHPDGTGRRDLTHYGSSDTTVTSSSFSPDGNWVVFGVTHQSASKGDLFVMRSDGRDVRALTRTTLYESAPEWGP